MPPVARMLLLPDAPGPTAPGQALLSQTDGTIAWGTPGGGSGTVPTGWLDVKAFGGAAGNGITDDSTAIQNTIAAVHAAGGGTVYFPPGTYVCEGLSLDLLTGITLLGAGPAMQFQSGPSILLFTGTGTAIGALLTMNSSTDCELRNLQFHYNNNAFTGDLISVDGGPHGADCQTNLIYQCSSKYTGTGSGSGTARSIMRWNKAVINSIRKCHFTGANDCLRLGDPGGSYVVSLYIDDLTFNSSGDAHILVGSADCEKLTVSHVTFEAGTNTPGLRGTTIAADGGLNQMYVPTIEGNWFGDPGAPVIWINGLNVVNADRTGIIRENYFAGAGQAGSNLLLTGAWISMGNTFDGGVVFSGTGTVLSIGDRWGNITSLFPGTNTSEAAAIIGGAGSQGPLNQLNQMLKVTGANALLTDDGASDLRLCQQAFSHGEAPTFGAGGTITWASHISGLHIASTGQFDLLTGANPQQLIAGVNASGITGQKLGLFGANPVVCPATTGTSTGFTAGAGSPVDSLGTFTGNVGMPTPSGLAVSNGGTPGAFAAGTYFYVVTATDAQGETLGSSEVSATAATNGAINLSWNPVTGAATYRIYRATSSGGETTSPAFLRAILANSQTPSTVDTGTAVSSGAAPLSDTSGGLGSPTGVVATAVAPSSFGAGTYFWQVTALNAAGETVGSNEVSATLTAGQLPTLTCNPAPGQTKWKVYRATSSGGESTSPALVTTITNAAGNQPLAYTDTGSATTTGAVPASSTAITAFNINDIVKALKQLGALTG